MKSSFDSVPPAIVQAGSHASRYLLAPKQCGKVLAAFSRVIYFITKEGEIFWLATTDSPMHRRCVQIPSPLPGLTAGSQFRVEDRHLKLDPDFIVDLEGLSLWSAPSIDSLYVLSSSGLPAQIDSVFSRLDLSNAQGFGQFIPDILSVSRNQSSFSTHTDAILAFAQPHVLKMAHACLNHQLEETCRIADRLIGLGSGLTPSGDDFIGGLLFAHQVLRAAYPDTVFGELAMPVEIYRSRTHPISFTLLRDLANGHGIEPLHHILNSLLSSKPIENIEYLISQLTQVGNSTGWDLLAGLLTGLLVTHQTHRINFSASLHQNVKV
jgi:hypothetical protein